MRVKLGAFTYILCMCLLAEPTFKRVKLIQSERPNRRIQYQSIIIV